jgi:hypothetical protein
MPRVLKRRQMVMSMPFSMGPEEASGTMR